MRVRGAFANDVLTSGRQELRHACRGSLVGAREQVRVGGEDRLPPVTESCRTANRVARCRLLWPRARRLRPAPRFSCPPMGRGAGHHRSPWAHQSLPPRAAESYDPFGVFWCRRWRRNTTDGNQSISEITKRTTIERLGSTSLSADGARSIDARPQLSKLFTPPAPPLRYPSYLCEGHARIHSAALPSSTATEPTPALSNCATGLVSSTVRAAPPRLRRETLIVPIELDGRDVLAN